MNKCCNLCAGSSKLVFQVQWRRFLLELSIGFLFNVTAGCHVPLRHSFGCRAQGFAPFFDFGTKTAAPSGDILVLFKV